MGLLPNISFPFVYHNDGLSHAWLAQRVIEGEWYFDNPRSGYPFGSNFLDYPNSDLGSFIALKILGSVFGSFQAATNLYFLLGFPLVFVASYSVLRYFALSRVSSIAAALVFTFIPFHFFRIGHLFFTWYFVVPLFFYYCHKFYFGSHSRTLNGGLKRFALHLCVLLALGSFGVYYAFFGVLIMLACGLAGSIRNRATRNFYSSIAASAVVIFAVAINLVPNLHHRIQSGANTEAAERKPLEAEIYGLKLHSPPPPQVVPMQRKPLCGSTRSKNSSVFIYPPSRHSARLACLSFCDVVDDQFRQVLDPVGSADTLRHWEVTVICCLAKQVNQLADFLCVHHVRPCVAVKPQAGSHSADAEQSSQIRRLDTYRFDFIEHCKLL